MRESLRTSATLLASFSRSGSHGRARAATLALLAAISFAAPSAAQQSPAPAAKATVKRTGPKDTAAKSAAQRTAADSSQTQADIGRIIERIATSGRVLLVGETSSSRLDPPASLAPGAAPILTFRYLDGQARHRFGDLDLVMDDAGH